MMDIETRNDSTNAPKGSRRKWPWALAGVALIAIVTAGGIVWFLGGDAPAEVDLAATADAVEAGDAGSSGDIAGTWVVDTSVGEFSVADDTTATFAGFRVAEVLASIGSTTAVGRTPMVTGTVAIEGTTLTSAEVVVDLTAIVSDQSRREDAIQRALGTSTNPDATFVLSEPVELGSTAASGETITTVAVGDLTINGVTEPVEIQLQAAVVDEMILVTGSTGISFADFAVSTPSAPVVVSVEDHGVVEIQLWLSQTE